MARRTAYLCIGLPGALGTRTVADLLSGHADTLAVAGHHLPAGADETRRAAWEITRDHAAYTAAGLRRRDVEGTWDGIWRRAYRARPRHVVLAEDGFAHADSDQVALALDAMAGFRKHVVVVAADPADLLARAWTEAVRSGRSMPLLRFRDRLEQQDVDQTEGHEQARRWWAAHHLADVLERWSAHVPADRIHVVVVSGDERARTDQVGLALSRLLGTRALTAPATLDLTPSEERADSMAPRALPSTVLSAMRHEARSWAEMLRDSAYDVHGEVGALVPRLPGLDEPALAGLTADDRLHLAGDALADARVQLEGLRRENAALRERAERTERTEPRRRPRHKV